MSAEERLGQGNAAMPLRSPALLPILEGSKPWMAAIAEQFVCYQYDDRKYPFRDGGWDLFFWCNCFFNTMPGHRLDGRDYSYFTLSFNEEHSAEKRKEICDSVLVLLEEKFPANPHLEIALQYSSLLDYTRIKTETAVVIPKLLGKTCSFRGKDGRIQQVEARVFFFPKRYRRYGYPLDDLDLLNVAWSLGISTEVPA